MYSPLAYWDAKKGGKRVGIIGIGGLGQMGVSWHYVHDDAENYEDHDDDIYIMMKCVSVCNEK